MLITAFSLFVLVIWSLACAWFGYRLGAADRHLRQFVARQRRARQSAELLELQRRARFESECG